MWTNKLLTFQVNSIYDEGRDLFQGATVSSKYNLFSNTPLEAAYYWTLSCRASKGSILSFGLIKFHFKCKELDGGRIFPNSSSSEYDFSSVKENVMYYATERNGYPMHPLADLWFKTQENELVLVDITGGKAEEKQAKLAAWINTHRDDISVRYNKLKVLGVVLAPNDDGESSYDKETDVVALRKDKARGLLGGLTQVMRWFW